MRNNCLIFLFLVLLASCKKEISTLSEYNQYINDLDNGLKKERVIYDLKISVKLLPPDYLMLKEINSTPRKDIPKVFAEYQNSLNFSLTLSFGDKKNDVGDNPVSIGVKDYKEYKERFVHLNFELYEDIVLKANEQEYTPVLISFENTYGQSNELNTTIVFSPKKDINEFQKASTYVFTYNDRIYLTGFNRFTFKREDLDNSPHINFKI